MPCEKMDLQVCTSSNFRQEIDYKVQEKLVKEEENGVQNSPSIPQQTKQYSTLQARCLTNCSREADEAQSENVLATTKGTTKENAYVCQKRLAKKAAKCRKDAGKMFLLVMIGACKGQRPWFLADGLSLSKMLGNSMLLIDLMKKIHLFRGGMEDQGFGIWAEWAEFR